MIDTVFFFFIVTAVLCYGIQGSLQTTFARKYDAFVVALYRNLSLAITMLPVLFFASQSEILEIQDHLGTLFFASGTGAFSLICALTASRYLPIGVSTAIRHILSVTMALLLASVFLGEHLTLLQLTLLAGIVGAGAALALLRTDHPHLDPRMVWRGIGLTSVAGIVVAISFYFFSALSREINPLVAGYFWEVGVGVFVIVYVCIATFVGRRRGSFLVPAGDLMKMVLIAALTIAATASFGFAVNHGPYALATGLLTTTTLVATVMGWILYKEHLTRLQVGIIFLAVLLIFVLKTLS